MQRASMYPPGHPAAGAGLDPFLASASPLLAEGRVAIAVGRVRLVVAVGPLPPNEFEAAWLAGRLFDREIASLVIEPDLDAVEAGKFISWLSQGPDEARDTLPALPTIRLARFDGSLVRFREDEARSDTPGEVAVWRALTAPLAQAYGVTGANGSSDDPVLFAEAIRAAIQASEGTGIADLATRLIDVHQRAMEAGEHREMATRRLAAIVSHLVPELRGSLISAAADDDPAKLRLLEEILENVPSATVAAIIGGLRIDHRPATAAFGRFLQKLVRLSLADPGLSEAIEARLGQSGLAPELFSQPARRAADDGAHPEGDIDRQAVPDEYRMRLEAMAHAPQDSASAPPEGSSSAEALGDAASAYAHVVRIALLQTERLPVSDEAAAFWRLLLTHAARARTDHDVEVLSKIADRALRLTGAVAPPPDIRAVLADVQRFFGEAESVELAIQSLLRTSVEPGATPSVLLAAGGPLAAQQALTWSRQASDRIAAGRVLGALASFDDATFRNVVLPGVAATPHLAELFPLAIDHVESSRAIELASFLATLDEPAVRLAAVRWLTQAQLSSGKRHWLLRRALDDHDPRIVEVGVAAAASDDSAVGSDTLLYFVHRRVPAALAGLQIRAVRALRMDRATVVQPLTRVLLARRLACSGRARRLSVEMAEALGRSTLDDGRAAARAWWWSPAGALSILTFTRSRT